MDGWGISERKKTERMNAGRLSILYVHNDLFVPIAFRALFRKEFEVFSAPSAAEARLILKQQNIAVLLADQQLSDSAGNEFLQSASAANPDLIKILVFQKDQPISLSQTAKTDRIDFYLSKPCDEFEFATTVKNAAGLYSMQAELKEKNLLLQKTRNELEKFVYSISHDLKSPLMSVKGIVNLAKTETEYKGQEYLTMIEKSIHKLDLLLGKSVHYYQDSKTGLQPAELRFGEMIRSTWESLDAFENKSAIRFQVTVQPEEAFSSDQFRVQTILTAVLSNAIRFQDKTRTDPFVTVDVSLTKHVATLLIEDNGTGIDHADKNRIFSIFHKGAQPESGSGLGLYIAKEAADSIGGVIEVFSEKGKGSVFKVVIPNRNDPASL